MVGGDAIVKTIRRKQIDWITVGVAGFVLVIDLLVVPAIAYWDAHVSKVNLGTPPPLIALGVVALLPLMIFIVSTRVSRKVLANRALAWFLALVVYAVLVTVHWATIYVLGNAEPPPSSMDDGPAHGIVIAVFFSYFLGVIFSFFSAMFLALRAVS